MKENVPVDIWKYILNCLGGEREDVCNLPSNGSGKNSMHIYKHTHMHVCRGRENDKINGAKHKQLLNPAKEY